MKFDLPEKSFVFVGVLKEGRLPKINLRIVVNTKIAELLK